MAGISPANHRKSKEERRDIMAERKRRAAADFLKGVQAMANEIFGEEDSEKKTQYIDTHMRNTGYKPVTTWTDPEGNGGGGGEKADDNPFSGLFGEGEGGNKKEGGGWF
jgi:hypothetical protein